MLKNFGRNEKVLETKSQNKQTRRHVLVILFLFGDILVFDVIFEINKEFFECNLFDIREDHMA